VSSLHQHVEDYLRVRRALGFKLAAHGPLLNDFVDDLNRSGTSTLTIAAAVAWATKPQGVQPYRWRQRLSVIRGFACYLHALDPTHRSRPLTC
jgi:integrase/recombinase XerD